MVNQGTFHKNPVVNRGTPRTVYSYWLTLFPLLFFAHAKNRLICHARLIAALDLNVENCGSVKPHLLFCRPSCRTKRSRGRQKCASSSYRWQLWLRQGRANGKEPPGLSGVTEHIISLVYTLNFGDQLVHPYLEKLTGFGLIASDVKGGNPFSEDLVGGANRTNQIYMADLSYRY